MQWTKALIENGVVYIKVNGFDHQNKVRKNFINSALYNDMKVKTTIGCWINPETCETEKVMRIELVSGPKSKLKKEPKTSYQKCTVYSVMDCFQLRWSLQN